MPPPSSGGGRALGMLTGRMADFSPEELLELFQRAQAQFTDRVDAVAPDQWEDPALPEWTVADLVAHLVTEQLWVAPLMAGEPYAEGRFPDDTSDLLGNDPFLGWESAADDALSAFAEDERLIRTVHLSRGPTPAAVYIHRDDRGPHRARLGPRLGHGRRHRARRRAGHRRPGLRRAAAPRGRPRLIDPPLDVSDAAPPQTRLLARFGRKG